MYIGYANFILNAKLSKEKTDTYSLKDTYTHLDSLKFPISQGNLLINRIEVCSNSRGCTPKTPHAKSNYLVKLKNTSTNGKTYKNVDDGKYVLMNMKGVYNLNGVECNVYLRVPRSGVIGVRLGLSKQKEITLNQNIKRADKDLLALGSAIEKDVFNLFKGGPQNYRPRKTRELSLANITVFGLNLFNPTTGNRPSEKIDDFADFAENLEQKLNGSHRTDFEPTNSKAVIRANFKAVNKDYPPFGVTQWGMVDMVGVKSLESAIKMKEHLLRAFGKLKNSLNLNNSTNKPLSKAAKRQKGCSNRNPAPDTSGKCPESYIPLPTKKKQICCYKKKLSQSKILEKYANAGVDLPIYLRNMFQDPPPVVKKNILVPFYNLKSKKMLYKKKQWTLEKCSLLPKPQLIEIAKSMGANPGRFKKDICASITKKLQNSALEKRKNVRRKFLRLTNKAYTL